MAYNFHCTHIYFPTSVRGKIEVENKGSFGVGFYGEKVLNKWTLENVEI
jgi:hypothetical protein